MTIAYEPDRSLKGKLRRRLVRLAHRRPLTRGPERPILSISFDDAPATAAFAGARILEARGLRGTYYVSASLAGQPAPMGICATGEDYRRLAEAGHEIACHTYSHLDCGQATGDEAMGDCERNLAQLDQWSVDPVCSFAFPYGDVAAGPKQRLAERFATLRGLHHGVIAAGTDLNQLPAVGIEGAGGEATALSWLGVAAARPAWLILYTHDVAEQPSAWGATPASLERIIDRALELGFEIETVGRVTQTLLGGFETGRLVA